MDGDYRPGADAHRLERLIHTRPIDTLPNDYVASEQVLSLLLHDSLSRFRRSTEWDQGVMQGQGMLCARSGVINYATSGAYL